MVRDLQGFQPDCADAFKMECSKEDLKNGPQAKRLAKYINKQGRRIDRITKLQRKVMDY